MQSHLYYECHCPSNHYYNITVFKHIPLVSTSQDLWVHSHNDGFPFLMGQTVEEPGTQLRSGRVNRTGVKYCAMKQWTCKLIHNCSLFRVSDRKITIISPNRTNSCKDNAIDFNERHSPSFFWLEIEQYWTGLLQMHITLDCALQHRLLWWPESYQSKCSWARSCDYSPPTPIPPWRQHFWCLLLTHPRVNLQKDHQLAFSWITYGLHWACVVHRQRHTRPHSKTSNRAFSFILI